MIILCQFAFAKGGPENWDAHLLLPSIFSNIRVFSNESALLIRWPKYSSFSFRISPSNKHSRLISFKIDWLDLLAVQGTLKSLFQHHSLKASILQCSAFFMVQLSHPHMTAGKTIALIIGTFVGKVRSLLFNILSRFVIAFLPKRSVSHRTWQKLVRTNQIQDGRRFNSQWTLTLIIRSLTHTHTQSLIY